MQGETLLIRIGTGKILEQPLSTSHFELSAALEMGCASGVQKSSSSAEKRPNGRGGIGGETGQDLGPNHFEA